MADPHAEFAPDVVAKIGDAVLARLRADAGLVAFFAVGEGIVDVEAERLALQGASIKAPMLGVALGPNEERRIGNDNYTELKTAVDLILLTEVEQPRGANGWLRARLVNRVKALLAADSGTLLDDEGNRITEALVEFSRLDFGAFGGVLAQQKRVVVTALRATYQSNIDQISREFEE